LILQISSQEVEESMAKHKEQKRKEEEREEKRRLKEEQQRREMARQASTLVPAVVPSSSSKSKSAYCLCCIHFSVFNYVTGKRKLKIILRPRQTRPKYVFAA
jgi:hypothetical protein